MFPVIFEIAGVKIFSYGFFIAIGYVCALLIGRSLAKCRGLDPAPFMDIAFLALVTGILGARLFFVFQNLDTFVDRPGEIFNFWNGGLVFYGGFIVATISCVLYGYWQKMPLGLSSDIGFTSAAFGHAFGRFGCFAAGCCYGSVCPYPWGVHNKSEYVHEALQNQSLHPVQLYEAFSLFVLAGILIWMVRVKKTANGMVTLCYLIGYAGIRFVTEIFRGDIDRGSVLGGLLSTSQAISITLFVIGSGILIRRLRGHNL